MHFGVLQSEAALQNHTARSGNPPEPEILVAVNESLASIIEMLNPSETPSAALRRLAEGGTSKRTPAAAHRGKTRKNRVLPALLAAAEREEAAAAAAGERERENRDEVKDAAEHRKAFNKLTEICTALLATGRSETDLDPGCWWRC